MPIRKQKKFGTFFKRTEAEKQIFKTSKDLNNTQAALEEAMKMIQKLSEEINDLKGNTGNAE